MKFKLELLIDKPRAEVWKAFDDPQRMKDWQPSLVRHELIDGISGQPGAVSKLTYTQRDREFTLTEKVTRRDEPGHLDGSYENEFAINTVDNEFIEQGADKTLWVVNTEYRFKTFMMKLMGPVLKKNFVARTERDMRRFKEMVESQ